MFNLQDHIAEQTAWSEATFGPREHRDHVGPLNHLLKEIDEIRKDPQDIMERVDALFLVIDGAHRAGIRPLGLDLAQWDDDTPMPGCDEADYLGWLERDARELRVGGLTPHHWAHLFRYAVCSALRAGFNIEQLGEAMTQKLAINKARTWPDWRTAKAGAPLEHVRTYQRPDPDAWELAAGIGADDVALDRIAFLNSIAEPDAQEQMVSVDQLQLDLDEAMEQADDELMTEMDLKHAEGIDQVPFVDFHPADEYIAKQRRDEFARAALQGLLASGNCGHLATAAERAVLAADYLIAELGKPQG